MISFANLAHLIRLPFDNYTCPEETGLQLCGPEIRFSKASLATDWNEQNLDGVCGHRTPMDFLKMQSRRLNNKALLLLLPSPGTLASESECSLNREAKTEAIACFAVTSTAADR
jgi:hypothetical protein